MPFAITIPTGRSADAGGSGPRGPVINLPIGLRSTSAGAVGSGTKTNEQALAALVAGAVQSPIEATKLAETAREDPGEVEAIDVAKKKSITLIRDAIKAAQDDPERTYDLPEAVRTVSLAIGANPRLAAAAWKAVDKDDDNGEAARLWGLALLNVDVVDRAARAATMADALDATLSTPVQLADLKADLDALTKDVPVQIEAAIDALRDELTKQKEEINRLREDLTQLAQTRQQFDELRTYVETEIPELKKASLARGGKGSGT